ncbi:DDE transposase family protein [Argonema antarcticum]|uniref:DDE transposase family protein n=1 Tax=Argonema antarcticum TaxID=2942763 RepID=UPI0020118192|nr:DDE transposase family protein [Argonema antarcticum]MCL1474129.1 DDE transposase family protein [Argonema antarcticum A004/B2]
MDNSQTWYIVKRNDGHCDIILSHEVEGKEDPNIVEKWGPIASQQDALARRVGLIRAGKCQPV